MNHSTIIYSSFNSISRSSNILRKLAIYLASKDSIFDICSIQVIFNHLIFSVR